MNDGRDFVSLRRMRDNLSNGLELKKETEHGDVEEGNALNGDWNWDCASVDLSIQGVI